MGGQLYSSPSLSNYPYSWEDAIRGFQTVDPVQLEKKVPIGYRQVIVQTGRAQN
jgi:hypothetical protein